MRPLTVAALLCASQAHAVGECVDTDDAALVETINAYRVANGLQPVAVSRSLHMTAQWHLWDRTNNPGAVGGQCNTHSWSSNPPAGVNWIGMCYTANHAQAAQMWGKPGQISAGAYAGNGYELAAECGCAMTPQQALFQWQGSPAHNPVILQQGVWASVPFTGIGASISGPFAVLWFGDGSEPNVALPPCSTDNIHANGFEG